MRDESLSQYEQEWQQHFGKINQDDWLLSLRQQQLKSFLEQGFPLAKNEQWKYTNLYQFKKQIFRLKAPQSVDMLSLERQDFFLDTVNRLVFIDGLFTAELSTLQLSHPSLIVTSLSCAFKDYPEILQANFNEQKIKNVFLNLNIACMQDGAFILIPANCCLAEPLHLLFISTENAANCMQHIHNIIFIEANAKATIIEEHRSLSNEIYFKNAVTQIHANEASQVEYFKLQNQQLKSFHIANTIIEQKKNSSVIAHNYSLGSQLAREDIHCFLKENGASLKLQGLYLPFNQQHMDIHTYVHHCADQTSSEEFFKGIAANRSRAIFNGKIMVEKNTHHTSANLQNKNLLLSHDSEINTKPELEIYSNDVKCCRHGATVGQIDQEMVFYLCSREFLGNKPIKFYCWRL